MTDYETEPRDAVLEQLEQMAETLGPPVDNVVFGRDASLVAIDIEVKGRKFHHKMAEGGATANAVKAWIDGVVAGVLSGS